jgi:translocation and assembly module TamB
MRSSSNPKMDIQFTGNLDVRKRPHTEPTVYGDISVIPENSRIEQFGRRFNIERGNLTFTGSALEPDIDLAGAYRVPSRGTGTDEVVIRLIATGRLDDLRVTFSSDPAMELADVISYIATGRPASGSLQFGGGTSGSYLSTAAGLAVGPISSLMEEFALAGLGLDVVEIENDGIRGLTLTVGKYVSPDFYVSVSQPIALSGSTESSNQGQERSTQVTMEYEIVRRVLLSLLNRGSVLRINLRWEHAY